MKMQGTFLLSIFYLLGRLTKCFLAFSNEAWNSSTDFQSLRGAPAWICRVLMGGANVLHLWLRKKEVALNSARLNAALQGARRRLFQGTLAGSQPHNCLLSISPGFLLRHFLLPRVFGVRSECRSVLVPGHLRLMPLLRV